MKIIIGVIILVVVMVTLVQMQEDSVLSYVKEETTVEVIEVQPVWATDEDAVKAAQDVIKKKELEANLKTKDVEISEAEEVVKRLKEERKVLTTELTAY